MDWEHAEEYEERSAHWDNIQPSAPNEVLNDEKIDAFRNWLLRRQGLKLSRRIATFEVYELESGYGVTGSLCQRSERFMLKLTQKVVRGWNGEWEVMNPIRELGIRPDRSWSVLVQRLAPDSLCDLVSFKLIRSDDEGGMPFSALTPQPRPARIFTRHKLDSARRARCGSAEKF